MGGNESRPAPKSEDSGLTQVFKYGAVGAIGAVALKLLIDAASTEASPNHTPPNHSSNPGGYVNGNTVRSSSQHQHPVRGPSYGPPNHSSNPGGYVNGNTVRSSSQHQHPVRGPSYGPHNHSSNPGGYVNGNTFGSSSRHQHHVQGPSYGHSNLIDDEARRALQRWQSGETLKTKIKACEEQIRRFDLIIGCYQEQSAEIQIITGELNKWIDHEKVIQDELKEIWKHSSRSALAADIPPPSDERMNKFMQSQMNADCLEKIFWGKRTKTQKNFLNVLLDELKLANPNEPESTLRKGVILAYNKHKWCIIHPEIKRYTKRSQELFLEEKKRVNLLCSSFNIEMNNGHPLEKFMLWKNFQRTIERTFWEEGTPEKKELLDLLMAKLTEKYPDESVQKLRRAVIKVFNMHKRGVRPREFNYTLQLVGNLLEREKKDDKCKYDEVEDLCSVCLGEHDATQVFLQCGHSFHRQCISTWIEEHNSCPNCRTPCSQISVRPIAGTSVTSTVQSPHVSTGAIRRQAASGPPSRYVPSGAVRRQAASGPPSAYVPSNSNVRRPIDIRTFHHYSDPFTRSDFIERSIPGIHPMIYYDNDSD